MTYNDGQFQAVVCIDSIWNIGGRAGLLGESFRVLKPGGQLLYTDTHVLTGTITFEEIADRANIKMHFDFTPPGENEHLLESIGFVLEIRRDVTENMVQISRSMHNARRQYHDELMIAEEEEEFENTQRFLLGLHGLASGGRLSRFIYVARKP